MNKDNQFKLAQNAVALSATIHGSERYKEFHAKNADKLNGFTGIWEQVAKIAQYMTEVEVELEAKEDPWACADWISTLDHIAEHFFDQDVEGEQDWKETILGIIEDYNEAGFSDEE